MTLLEVPRNKVSLIKFLVVVSIRKKGWFKSKITDIKYLNMSHLMHRTYIQDMSIVGYLLSDIDSSRKTIVHLTLDMKW